MIKQKPLEILLEIKKNGAVTVKQLTNNTKMDYSTIYRHLKTLERYSFISKSVEPILSSSAYLFNITEEGEKFLKLVK